MNDFEPLPPKALTVIRLRLLAPAGFVIVVLLVGAVAAFLGDVAGATTYGLVLAAVAVLVLAGWWVFSGLVFRAYGWKLTDGTVELRHGVVVQRHQVLPRARVQNVTKEAGPVSRAFGLASITVHSAGANTPNITVPDLTVEVGDRLRTNLLPAAR
ncbi:MAG TPA: PH domain-containing protein [Microthrixaceae bacterium]|nr:PH domain-containing protein [Microthrixaceae bacterium]